MSVLTMQAQQILGNWTAGFVLDDHTVSSTYEGENEFGHSEYTTVRTPVGEALYQLKYQANQAMVVDLADTAASFVGTIWKCAPTMLVPMPSTNARAVPPVPLVGQALAAALKIKFEAGAVARTQTLATPIKNQPLASRPQLLAGIHSVVASKVSGEDILLFDDLYQTGSTMNAVAGLLSKAGARNVYALALTRTRR